MTEATKNSLITLIDSIPYIHTCYSNPLISINPFNIKNNIIFHLDFTEDVINLPIMFLDVFNSIKDKAYIYLTKKYTERKWEYYTVIRGTREIKHGIFNFNNNSELKHIKIKTTNKNDEIISIYSYIYNTGFIMDINHKPLLLISACISKKTTESGIKYFNLDKIKLYINNRLLNKNDDVNNPIKKFIINDVFPNALLFLNTGFQNPFNLHYINNTKIPTLNPTIPLEIILSSDAIEKDFIVTKSNEYPEKIPDLNVVKTNFIDTVRLLYGV